MKIALAPVTALLAARTYLHSAEAEVIMFPVLRNSADETMRQMKTFLNFFRYSYDVAPEVPVAERVDPTVRFIGSPTNVVKPHILQDRLPDRGIAVAQTCLRTQNLDALVNAQRAPERCSVIPMLGLVASARTMSEMAGQVAAYFLSLPFQLGDCMTSWVSSSDLDLVDLCHNELARLPVQVDTQPINRYRHVYGVEGMYGRNLNFGITTRSGRTDQIGNLVVIEWNGQPRAVEFGISIPMLLSLCNDLPHPICATPVGELFQPRTPVDIWLADALATAQLLITEGLRPRHHGRNRTVRKALWRTARLIEQSSFEIYDVARVLRLLFLLRNGPAAAELSELTTRYIERAVELFNNEATGIPDHGPPLSRIL